MASVRELVHDELERLLEILPPRVNEILRFRDDLDDLFEIFLDFGKVPEARLPSGDVTLDDAVVTRDDLEY